MISRLWDDELVAEFPEVFENTWFECGQGWKEILKEGAQKLVPLIREIQKKDPEYKFRTTQIKEKYAQLRWYIGCASDEMYEIIKEIESKSTTICELCGSKDAKVRGRVWIATRCNDCYKEENFL